MHRIHKQILIELRINKFKFFMAVDLLIKKMKTKGNSPDKEKYLSY